MSIYTVLSNIVKFIVFLTFCIPQSLRAGNGFVVKVTTVKGGVNVEAVGRDQTME